MARSHRPLSRVRYLAYNGPGYRQLRYNVNAYLARRSQPTSLARARTPYQRRAIQLSGRTFLRRANTLRYHLPYHFRRYVARNVLNSARGNVPHLPPGIVRNIMSFV